MKRIILLIAVLAVCVGGAKAQKFALIDMEYILKNIPAYETRMSSLTVEPNETCSIPLSSEERYNYTKFQCIIAVYNSDYSTNMVTKYVSMNDGLFSVETSNKVSNITKNSNTKSIDLNITNNSQDTYIIIYFTYKEI